MLKNQSWIWVYFALVLLLAAATWGKYSASLEELPVGCDEFGYLQLSESFDERSTLGDHQERSYFKPLFDTLSAAGFAPSDFTWMITPHAYHYHPQTQQIINQYAPATSWLMSWVPLQIRSTSFPILVILLWFLVPTLVSYFTLGAASAKKMSLFLIVLYPLLTLAPSFGAELGRINSVSPTWGLLIAAGIVFRSHPLWSVFLIACSANFRQVNLLLIVPVAFYLLFPFIQLLRTHDFKQAGLFLGKHLAALILGFTPYLLYAGLLLENPFSLTYSVIDTASVTLADVAKNLRFYLIDEAGWLWMYLLALVPLIAMRVKQKIDRPYFLVLLVVPLVVYGFFFSHLMRIPYYPYAGALFLMGCALREFTRFQLMPKLYWIAPALTLIFCIDGINRYFGKEHLSFAEAKSKYQSLCAYDIVWGDLLTGTSEYACNNAGFLIHGGPSKARIIAFKHLAENGLKQLILLEDSSIPAEQLQQELGKADVSFEIIQLPELGVGVVVLPQ